MIGIHKDLESLCLNMNYQNNISSEDVAQLIGQSTLSKLAYLQVQSTNLHLFNCQILKSIISLENLTSLHLSQCLNEFQETYNHLFEFLQKCSKKLENLSLAIKINFDQEEFLKIFELNLPNLKFLGLHLHGNIKDDSFLRSLGVTNFEGNYLNQKVIMNSLNHSNSIKVLRLDTNLYVRQNMTCSEWSLIEHVDFFDEYSKALAEIFDAFRYSPYQSDYGLGRIYINEISPRVSSKKRRW